MRVNFILVIALLSLLLMTSCSSGRYSEAAKHSVDQFHSEFDSEQYNVLYAAADEGLHKTTTEADFVALLQAIHRKLGKVQQSQLRTFEVGWFTTQGTVVTLVYDTTFVGGVGTEQFVWHIRENRPVLFGYHINSNALIQK